MKQKSFWEKKLVRIFLERSYFLDILKSLQFTLITKAITLKLKAVF